MLRRFEERQDAALEKILPEEEKQRPKPTEPPHD